MFAKNRTKITIITISLFLLLTLAGCITFSTDETKIEQIGKNIENAIEEEDVDLFMENASFDYSDLNGGTYDNHINNLPENIISQMELAEDLIGSIPGFVDEINEPPTISKKMDHTITEEGYIIDDPNEEFGGWVSGIFGNNVTNSKLTEINNEKIIVNFNQYHEMKDICNYEISSVHATYIHTLFSTIIGNYKISAFR